MPSFSLSTFVQFSFCRFIRDNLLTMATLCGAIAGVALGLSLKSMGDGIYTPRQARYVCLLWRRKPKLISGWTSKEFCFSYVGYPGKLFLNMLKCLIIPLVVPSLIASIGSLDFRMSGKVRLINLSSAHTNARCIGRLACHLSNCLLLHK